VALLVQGSLTAPMMLLGTQPVWLWLLIPALFVGEPRRVCRRLFGLSYAAMARSLAWA
jgi:hypothetical protein